MALTRNASALLKVGHWGVAGWGDGDAEDGEWESRLELRGDWEDGESVLDQARGVVDVVVGAGASASADGIKESEMKLW